MYNLNRKEEKGVAVEKLRCDLSTVFSSGPALVSAAPVTAVPVPDYSSLSKNELGRCLNSAIETICMDLAGGKERRWRRRRKWEAK